MSCQPYDTIKNNNMYDMYDIYDMYDMDDMYNMDDMDAMETINIRNNISDNKCANCASENEIIFQWNVCKHNYCVFCMNKTICDQLVKNKLPKCNIENCNEILTPENACQFINDDNLENVFENLHYSYLIDTYVYGHDDNDNDNDNDDDNKHEVFECQICMIKNINISEKFIIIDKCKHFMCRTCAKQHMLKTNANFNVQTQCPFCRDPIPDYKLREILSADELSQYKNSRKR